MQARITRFKMRQESVADALALIEQLKGDILALPGMRRFVSVMNPDGTGYVISLIDDDAGSSPESVDRVRAIWHKFSDYLEDMPTPEIFEVVADW